MQGLPERSPDLPLLIKNEGPQVRILVTGKQTWANGGTQASEKALLKKVSGPCRFCSCFYAFIR
jgi:hypothetical protein